MPSIFSKIIAGDIPSYRVAQSESCYAFLDIRPLQKGHTLVVPRIEVDYIFDLDSQTLCDLITFSKQVANAIKVVIPCNRIGLTIMGLEVPHAHIHLIPINEMEDMNFHNAPIEVSEADMTEIAKSIESAFESNLH